MTKIWWLISETWGQINQSYLEAVEGVVSDLEGLAGVSGLLKNWVAPASLVEALERAARLHREGFHPTGRIILSLMR